MAFNVGTEQLSSFNKFKRMNLTRRLEEFNRYNKRGDSPTPFSYLTPTQFAELFPKYYMEKLPDVGGFFKALRSQKELGGEGRTYGPHGNTGDQTAVPSSGARITNIVKAKEIYDYIRSKGVDHIHAVGIVNNIRHESNFDSGILGDGLTSGGLFQHHDGRDVHRFSNMKAYVGEDWQKNWKKQIDYALTESEMKKYLQTNPANVADASKNFTILFENPRNAQMEAARRADTAQKYSDAVSGPPGSATAMPTSGGGNYEITSSGFIVPKDKTSYTPGNEQQCATLAKGFNPEIGRSSSWTVVPGEIKPGVAVATMRYNLPGGDRTGSGYHSGIAMSAPDKEGNFLLLEQFNGQPPRVRPVNIKYGGGAMGGSTEFGIISSNGKLHNEQSIEALNYGAKISGEENSKIIQNNINSISNGNTAGVAQGVADSGSVSTPADQPQTNLQQQDTVKSIQTATIGDMFKMVGDLAGFFMRGEGVGGGHRGHRKKGKGGGMRVTDEERAFNVEYDPNIGKVAQQFEGRKGVETVSSGLMRKGKRQVADPGGVSYGAHQLSSKTKGRATGGTMAEFLKSGEGQAWADQFKGMMPGTKQFTNKYNEIVNNPESKQKLAEDQHKFIYRTHYVPTVQRAHRLGYDVNDPHVKEALYSASVQYRNNAKSIIARPEAMAGIGKPGLQQGSAIYDARNAFGHGQFATRIKDEKTALASIQPPVRTNIPTATVAKAEPAPSNGYIDQIKSKMSGYYEGFAAKMAGLREKASEALGSSVAQTPEFPAVGAKMNEVPLPPHRPTDLGNQPAPTPDKQTFNSAPAAEPKQQQPIVADTFLNRGNPQFASPSMERQIKNTMNPVASNEGHSFLPSIG